MGCHPASFTNLLMLGLCPAEAESLLAFQGCQLLLAREVHEVTACVGQPLQALSLIEDANLAADRLSCCLVVSSDDYNADTSMSTLQVR